MRWLTVSEAVPILQQLSLVEGSPLHQHGQYSRRQTTLLKAHQDLVGNISAETTIPDLRAFVKAGAYRFVFDALINQESEDGRKRPSRGQPAPSEVEGSARG